MMMQIRRGVLPMIGADYKEEYGVQNGKKGDDVICERSLITKLG